MRGFVPGHASLRASHGVGDWLRGFTEEDGMGRGYNV